ncbi:MAG: potassium transporter TrkG [Proteiniphilum sp.]|nr:potassium transporter TrkG [Proteiniphilum sp.]MDD3909067.1 potassium transporter TrkG [Proteiniphilum sp.]MDD4416586.1 potassium transporter TrkG [Proteiniphilum sp.]
MQKKFTIHKMLKVVSKTSFAIGTVSFFLAVFELGFPYENTWENLVFIFFNLTLFTGFLSILFRTVSKTNAYGIVGLITDWIFIFILFYAIVFNTVRYFKTGSVFEWNNMWTYIGLFIVFFREIYNIRFRFRNKAFNPATIFIISFLATIFIGSLLLMLPNASNDDITYVDALFTSTSAVCVTGLAVQNTGVFFTRFGQVVIMLLIQVGGLGIMTFTNYFSRFFTGQASFKSQVLIAETTAIDKFDDAFRTLRNIILVTFSIEAIGTLTLFLSASSTIIPKYGERLFFSLFHSVSSFCNAGFSTLPNNLYEEAFRFNYSVLLSIAFLIILGGIGFPILFNSLQFLRYKTKSFIEKFLLEKRDIYKSGMLSLNTKIILTTTSVLLISGTIILFFLEYNNTLAEHNTLWGKFVTSFFGAVTPRTAGFNSVNTAEMLLPATLFTILLMWIGASPASTGGGIKTSTFAIAVINVANLIRGRRNNVFGREINQATMNRAFAIIFLSLFVIGTSAFIILLIEPQQKVINVFFEVFSAYGTVGLSRGITSTLADASKIVLVITMFLGRVTMFTILMAFFRRATSVSYYHLPKEDLLLN